jgi:GTPase
MAIPKIAIVGRMNVGKSTLFNRLSVGVKSITLDYEGVTRDVLKDEVIWKGITFELLDTGGISVRSTQDVILEQVRRKAWSTIEEAPVIVFVVDAKVGIIPEDREISKSLHKLGKKVIVAVNKVDNAQAQEHSFEFERLGHASLVALSAQHGTGINELLDAMVSALPERSLAPSCEETSCRVVLLGKPNVGKSSLMNALLKQERSIVTDLPGTTREAISERLTFYKEDILLTDTAGVRRQRSVNEPLESLMVKSTLTAVKEADIILLLLDASQGTFADQELKLAFYAFNAQYKAVILVCNKQDLVQPYEQELLAMDLKKYEYFLKKIIKIDISCLTGKNIGKLLPLIKEVEKRYALTLPKHELTRLFKDALMRKPLYHKTRPLEVYWARQLSTKPITILLMVNEAPWFQESQRGFFEGVLRKEYDLRGVPVRFVVRGGKEE